MELIQTAAYCVTGIISAIIIAGGINRAAFYIAASIIRYMESKGKELDE